MQIRKVRRARTLTAARVHRVQQTHSFVTISAWCRGAVLVHVNTQDLLAATRLSLRQLQDAELTVRVFLDALDEAELAPTGWALAGGGRWYSADEALASRPWGETA